MGYYSEVAIAMSNKNYGFFMDAANKIEDTKLKEKVLACINDSETKKAGDYTVFHWSYIKWDDYFYPVSWIEHNLVAPYAKIRIGDDIEDTEIEYITDNADTGEEDYELYGVIELERGVHIEDQWTVERAIRVLNSLDYRVSYLSRTESEECNGAVYAAEKAYEGDIDMFDTPDELIAFAKEKAAA